MEEEKEEEEEVKVDKRQMMDESTSHHIASHRIASHRIACHDGIGACHATTPIRTRGRQGGSQSVSQPALGDEMRWDGMRQDRHASSHAVPPTVGRTPLELVAGLGDKIGLRGAAESAGSRRCSGVASRGLFRLTLIACLVAGGRERAERGPGLPRLE